MRVRKCIIVRYGELFLKGKNRPFFIQKLIANLTTVCQKNNLLDIQIKKFFDQLIIISEKEEQLTQFFSHLEKVFGISVFYWAYYLNSKSEELEQFTENLSNYYPLNFLSFRLDIKRNDKNFPENSSFWQEKLGKNLRLKYQLKVDLTHPEKIFFIRIYRQFILFFSERKKGLGGLPVGSTGQVLLLLSGGIDSPAAAYQLMKRGCEVVYCHFYYQRDGWEKITALGEKLRAYNNYSQVIYLVNFQSLLTEIRHISQEKYRLIILKRMFVRLANRLAEQLTIATIAGGDCLAQVASQTLESLAVIYQISSQLVLWPLITYNKAEVITQAQKIDTYTLSCQKYSDCCSLFEPPHPITKPQKEIAEQLEKEIWWEDILTNIFRHEIEKCD